MSDRRSARWLRGLLGLGLAVGALAATAAPSARPAAKPAQEIVGSVTRIVDGDTLWVTAEGGAAPVVVRLSGIDAPERCQPWGREATQALHDAVLGKTVTVRVVAHDDWGRTVGKVFDGRIDVGDRLVRDGHAWSTRYRYDRGPYVAEERMALALRRGLHASGGAIEPREFRKRHGPCENDRAGAVPAEPAAPAAQTSAARPAATASPQPVEAAFRCDGRVRCTQMRSCEEATWFLRHCPGVKMDGNGDGVPCERQWCAAEASRR